MACSDLLHIFLIYMAPHIKHIVYSIARRCCKPAAMAVALLWAAAGWAADKNPQFYIDLSRLPSTAIYQRGMQYFNNSQTADSALACFTILSTRYGEGKSQEEKLLCIKANAARAYLYYFHYFDYSKAFECMAEAERQMKEAGVEDADVYVNYGLMYCSLGEQSQDVNTTKRALSYLKRAFHAAAKAGNMHIMNMAFSNIIGQTYAINMPLSLDREWQIFRQHSGKKHDKAEYTRFTALLYQGVLALSNKQYKQADAFFNKQIALMPLDNTHSRYTCGAWEYKAYVSAAQGDYAQAISNMQRSLDIADSFNIRDAKIEIYRIMASYYGHLGLLDRQIEAEREHLKMKDSLINYQQVQKINEMRFLNELNQAESDIQRMATDKRHMQSIAITCAVVLLIILCFVYALYVKMKQLKESNRAIYDKNIQLMRTEEQERSIIGGYQRQLDQMSQALASAGSGAASTAAQPAGMAGSAPQPAPAPTGTRNETPMPHAPRQAAGADAAAPQPPGPGHVKYKGSTLTEDDKNVLTGKILKVMEDALEICSSDFSLERLAQLTGSRSKSVSQVINERYECNFNVFLNNFRIREACRRLGDPGRYGNPTMEVLSSDMGFKSRSTFVIQFKRVTGLTPSQYQKEASGNS